MSILILLCGFYSHAKRIRPFLVSDTYVVFEGDELWKYWPLLERIDHLVHTGVVEAHAAILDEKALSSAKIDSMRLYREVIPIEDWRYHGEMKDTVVSRYRSIENWYDGLVFTISWIDDGKGRLRGDLMAIGLTHALNIQGYEYGSLPAYFLKLDLLDQLSPSEQKLLKEALAKNCTHFSSATRLYSKERAFKEHPDSLFDLSLLKTRPFFDRNRLFFDQSLEEPIREFKQFDALLHTTDTLGLKWNTSYLWSYPKWLFFDHLVYNTHAEFVPENWQITLSWHSVGVSGQDRNKHSKSFYMSPETLQKEVSPLTWEQIKEDYLKGVLLGFERPTREP